MARYAVIEDGTVTMVIIADAAFIATYSATHTTVLVDGTQVGPQWTYDGETFSPPAE